MKALPNILSVFRICLVPVFVVSFVLDGSSIKYISVCIFIVANVSDILDGYIARRFEAQTKLGKLLDPLGDKLITFSALVCIAAIKPVLIWAACAYFIKEVLMGVGGFLIGRREFAELPPSNKLGKATTVTFFIVCVALLVFPGINDTAAVIMMSLAICLALAAFISYLNTFISLMKSGSSDAAPVNENTGENV